MVLCIIVKYLENEMKRFFTFLLSVSLAMVFFLSSGCSSVILLTFNNAFNDGKEPYAEYWEKLTYTVTSGEYKGLTRSTVIPKDAVEFSINGTLTLTLNTTHKDAVIDEVAVLPDEIKDQTDINLSGKLYRLTALLSLKSNYKVNGDKVDDVDDNGDLTDEIRSEVVFLTSENSFAPIYSSVKQSYHVMLASNESDGLKVNIDKLESEHKIIYSSDKYTITSTSKTEDGDKTTSSTIDYSFRSIIDNTQLLFALRNLSLEKEKSTSVLTVAPAYKNATNLLVKNNEEVSQMIKLNVNGKEVNENLSVKNLSFNVNDSKNTGVAQYVSIQKAKSENIPYKSLMIEYAEPLICYGSISTMGALIYRLSSVEYAI